MLVFFFLFKQVIDEIYRVLRFVQSTKKLFLNSSTTSHEDWNDLLKDVRANVILKELRDISSMAMEHFEEKILPSLKTPSNTPLLSFYNPSASSSPHFSSVSPLITLAQDLCQCLAFIFLRSCYLKTYLILIILIEEHFLCNKLMYRYNFYLFIFAFFVEHF